MRRLAGSVAKKTNNFDDIDREYAYAVWILEKEFNVGPIDENFLAMKFWNLLDETNTKRYNNDTNPKKGSKGQFANTFR